MADIELNALEVKSDSIPDNWLITLVDPTSGAVAKNMTVAKFVELFTQKQPEATSSGKGLMPSKDRKVISDIYKGSTASVQFLKVPAGQYLRITTFSTTVDMPAFGFDIINFSTHEADNGGYGYRQSCYELHVPDASYGNLGFMFMLCGRNAFSNSTCATKIIRCTDSSGITTNYFVAFNREVYVSATAIFQKGGSISVSASLEGIVYENHNLPERGVFTNTGSNALAYSLEKNALTDTISLNNSILQPSNDSPKNNLHSDSYNDKFSEKITDVLDDSLQIEQEKYIWSIEKIGQAVLRLQEENEQLKQIINERRLT